ncbi:hypothetical protein L208DRAFT_1395026 [Tricholoma matsutake]|nr:hypothetical protein L208DRAFT_1395026 [Tricholoma matsutake 945]
MYKAGGSLSRRDRKLHKDTDKSGTLRRSRDKNRNQDVSLSGKTVEHKNTEKHAVLSKRNSSAARAPAKESHQYVIAAKKDTAGDGRQCVTQ